MLSGHCQIVPLTSSQRILFTSPLANNNLLYTKQANLNIVAPGGDIQMHTSLVP